jgi:hypothetical protein
MSASILNSDIIKAAAVNLPRAPPYKICQQEAHKSLTGAKNYMNTKLNYLFQLEITYHTRVLHL